MGILGYFSKLKIPEKPAVPIAAPSMSSKAVHSKKPLDTKYAQRSRQLPIYFKITTAGKPAVLDNLPVAQLPDHLLQ